MATKPKKKKPKKGEGRGCLRGCLFLLVLLLVVAGAGTLAWRYETSPIDPTSRAFVEVTIPKDASARAVAEILKADHLVRSRRVFQICAVLADANDKLQPGVYKLSPAMTPSEMIGILVSGKTLSVSVVIPPGFTLKQIADRLGAANLADAGDFLELAKSDGRSFHAAGGFVPPDDNLEGYLYPDTYEINPGTPPRMIITQMLDNFEKRVVGRHRNVKNWRTPMIVASMVEREAKVPEDQPKIAGVIYNRLKEHMTLGIDATIEYALPVHKARLMFSDYRYPSPYNTYTHTGLPPTPICSPGMGAILAALTPEKSDYLYYFAGPGGRHIFTKTLAQHDAVIAKIRSGQQMD